MSVCLDVSVVVCRIFELRNYFVELDDDRGSLAPRGDPTSIVVAGRRERRGEAVILIARAPGRRRSVRRAAAGRARAAARRAAPGTTRSRTNRDAFGNRTQPQCAELRVTD